MFGSYGVLSIQTIPDHALSRSMKIGSAAGLGRAFTGIRLEARTIAGAATKDASPPNKDRRVRSIRPFYRVSTD
jgi:hypothetical protein